MPFVAYYAHIFFSELVWVYVIFGVDLVNQFLYVPSAVVFCNLWYFTSTCLGKYTNILGRMCNPSKLVIYYWSHIDPIVIL